ncbi:MAG: helicase-associated domain-containing protein [Sphaerochaetaceae bacterium]|nr:helicase-associated domain-containing protein [Sphaerochaetaceae bacterium]NLO60280.1 hypothetical protein [Spirochaetales bacterium]MDD2404899.1 helicase-associated domain-containing protein [Sphaerochaetaceae bacterium]MDD3670612.1 helicase-associated domain-containing protein [Sphaerochaetaceae bacterium]MDD4259405.1 helicase-associated domain-containing protein [Sphaerochaetaceae bacterium]
MSKSERDTLWERSLGTLPDTVFLNLMRNYLGQISTPFHKPQLIARLTTLFSNTQFLDRLFACITEWDARILTAAWLYGEVTQDELCALFVEDIPYIDIQQNVVNLEERLLLIPSCNQPEQRKTIITNPLLTDRLMAENVLSLPLLLGSSTTSTGSVKFTATLDHRLLRALFSLHIHEIVPSADKGQRYLRNPAILSIFTARPSELIALYLPMLERILIRLDVVKETGKETVLNIYRSKELFALEPYELQQLLFREFSKELLIFSHLNESKTGFSDFIGYFKTLMEAFDTVDASALRKILHISAAKGSFQIQRYRELVQLLIDMGIISQPFGTGPYYSINKSLRRYDADSANHNGRFTFTIDSDFTVTVSGEPRTKDGSDILHLICKVEKLDTICNYRLTRESYRHAIDNGCDLNTVIAYLEEMTGKRLPQHLRSALEHWNEESDSIRIYDGIAVAADERIGRLIEAIPALERHRIATICPGCFLFSRKNEHIWRQILSDASSVLLPQSVTEEAINHSNLPVLPLDVDMMDDKDATHSMMETLMGRFVTKSTGDLDFVDELKKKINLMHANKYDQEEMLARLDKRLILTSAQIAPPGMRSGPQSASGFDFQGKLNLIKATVASPNEMLELHVVTEEGDVKKLLVEAKELIGGNRDYTLRVSVLPEREEKIISADKIFLVRRLRRSVFFQ